jgi:hypothetical protein
MNSRHLLHAFALVLAVSVIPGSLSADCPESHLAAKDTRSVAADTHVGAGGISRAPGLQFGVDASADAPAGESASLWIPFDRDNTDNANPGKTVASDDKRKVPKKKPKKKKEQEGDDEEKCDDDGSGNPFADCLADMFIAIICSGDDDEETVSELEVTEVVPRERESASVYSVDGVDIPFTGVILPESPDMEVVNLWSAPGGPGSGGSLISQLRTGDRIHVLGLEYVDGDQPWLSVRTPGPDEVTGWVHVDYVVPKERYQPPDEVYEPPDGLLEPPEIESGQGEPGVAGDEPTDIYGAPIYSREPSRAEIVGGVGWSPVESQLRGEFGWSGIGAWVGPRFFPIPNLLLGLKVGYTGYWGEPEFDFEIDRDGRLFQKDIPLDSDIGILDLEAEIGVRITDFGKGNCPWGLIFAVEAGVSRVEQRSPVEYEVYDAGGSVTDRGRRDDVMTRWKAVVGGSGEVDYTFPGGLILGFHAGFKGIHWKPEETESMNLDWLEGDFISIFYCGLSLGYALN